MKDLFSQHALGYAAFRPTYPSALYTFLLNHVHATQSAWDCGTGNGQVARDLSKYFVKVYATDCSSGQLENAATADNIQYSIAPAEKTMFADSSFDLITVGQALHWFNIPEFYKEVIRVARPGGLLAVWGYGLLQVSPEIDLRILDFYQKTVGPYWDPERKLVDDQYKSIPFPFEEIKAPDFQFSFSWTLDHIAGYLTTWSSVQKFIKANGYNPAETLIEQIRPLWEKERLNVRFPLFLRCGRIRKQD